MYRIFRKIRLTSMKEKRLGQYLLYALGEIILVIAGILIALQINNLNERKKNEARIEAILGDVQNDLLTDLENLQNNIEIYERKDSLIGAALSDTLTETDYMSDPQLISLLATYSLFDGKDNAYKNLMRNSDFIPVKYGDLVPRLDELYLENYQSIKRIQENLQDLVSEILQKWSAEHTWYRDLNQGRYNPEFIEFFLNDPYYKNDLVTYRIYASGNLLRLLKRQELLSVQAYRAINQSMKTPQELPPRIKNYLHVLSEEQMERLIGSYRSQTGLEVRIFVKNGTLNGQLQGQSPFTLYPRSDSSLFNPVIGLEMDFHLSPEGPLAFDLLQNGQELSFIRQHSAQPEGGD